MGSPASQASRVRRRSQTPWPLAHDLADEVGPRGKKRPQNTKRPSLSSAGGWSRTNKGYLRTGDTLPARKSTLLFSAGAYLGSSGTLSFRVDTLYLWMRTPLFLKSYAL